MPFPAKPVAEWDKEDLEALIADPPAVENARWDFKADCNLLSDDDDKREKARRDILKDTAAMANGVGGTLLIGVRQTGDAGKPPIAVKIEGIQEVERLRQAIQGLASTHLDVRPARLECHPIPFRGDLHVLAATVPANTYSLSMITYQQANQFWVRKGTDNRPMGTDELQFRFEQFAKIRDSASSELAAIRALLEANHKRPFAWFAAVPVSRGIDHIPVRMQEIRRLIETSSYFRAYPERKDGSFCPSRYVNSLTPSLHGIGVEPSKRDCWTLEIRRDGVLVYGDEVLYDRKTFSLPDGEKSFDFVAVGAIYEVIASGLFLLLDIQKHYSVNPLAIVQAGIVAAGGTKATASRCHPHMPGFHEKDIVLDAVLLDEESHPERVFADWALQLGNALGMEVAPEVSPWIKPAK